VSFWLRIGAFALNIAVMFVVLRAAINRQASEGGGDEPSRNALADRVAP
jgi:hypothetical protein